MNGGVPLAAWKITFLVHSWVYNIVLLRVLLLSSTSSYVLLGRGSEKAFNECLSVSNVFHTKSNFVYL